MQLPCPPRSVAIRHPVSEKFHSSSTSILAWANGNLGIKPTYPVIAHLCNSLEEKSPLDCCLRSALNLPCNIARISRVCFVRCETIPIDLPKWTEKLGNASQRTSRVAFICEATLANLKAIFSQVVCSLHRFTPGFPDELLLSVVGSSIRPQ